MKDTQQLNNMSAVAAILHGLGLASFVAAQTSSFKDPMTAPVPTTKPPTRALIVFDASEYECAAASTSSNGRFHPDKYGTMSCTNSKDYPSAWESMTEADEDHEFLFDTMQECVDYFAPHLYLYAGDTVLTVNVCSPDCCTYTKDNGLTSNQCEGGCVVTTTTTTMVAPEPECEVASLYYHPPATMEPYCTNSNDYPAVWDNVFDGNGNKMFLFNSFDECCGYFTKVGFPREDCGEVDVCSPTDCCTYTKDNGLPFAQCEGGCTTTTTTQAPEKCEDYSFSLYWHPSLGDGFMCTNSPAYPEVWRSICAEPKFLYESAEDCCKDYYGFFNIPMNACEMGDLCPDAKSVSVASDKDEVITSCQPTDSPTKAPTKLPTNEPSESDSPTNKSPSDKPTSLPTALPTPVPSNSPTKLPTSLPTHSPSNNPTKSPSGSPTRNPSGSPTKSSETNLPTSMTPPPTLSPTAPPTSPPTAPPTAHLTNPPTALPTASPTNLPTSITPPPTNQPANPSEAPPTNPPTALPTALPSASPTNAPTPNPTPAPVPPTSPPTASPTDSKAGKRGKGKRKRTPPPSPPTFPPTASPTVSLSPTDEKKGKAKANKEDEGGEAETEIAYLFE